MTMADVYPFELIFIGLELTYFLNKGHRVKNL